MHQLYRRFLDRRFLLASLCAAVLQSGAAGVHAQSAQPYPSRPVTIVAPFAAGSGTDGVARAIAQQISPVLGQPVIVDNRAGAAGTLGAGYVARSAPDGHTLLLASISASVTASTMKLPFDMVKDFAPVTMVGTQPYVLIAPTSVTAPTLEAFLNEAKARPGKFYYATQGVGSISHLQWEAVKSERGLDLVHVPYKGTPEALTDLLAGRVHLLMIPLSAGLAQVKAGAVRALGVSGDKRAPALPEVPTLLEQGFPVLQDPIWYAFLMPAGTPPAAIRRFNQAYASVVNTPEMKEAFTRLGLTPSPASVEESTQFVRAQVEKWHKIVSASPGKFTN